MVYAYYSRLSSSQRAVYRASDGVSQIRLPDAVALRPCVRALRESLAADDRRAVGGAAAALSRAILDQLGIPPIKLTVLAVRPSRGWGELHGLYTADERKPAEVRVWMRTAHHRRVVAFRTFLRTLLHELCHHLDYHALKLADSLHTEGFFRRESDLFRQLVPPARGTGLPPSAAPKAARTQPNARSKTAGPREDRPAPTLADQQGRLPFD